MQPTNYHLFDFLDFSETLDDGKTLWKSCRPTAVKAVDGDVHITVPFQKQKVQADMAADESEPRKSYTLVLRQYNDKIIRLFCSFEGQEMTDESEMLQLSKNIQKIPLLVEEKDDCWLVVSTSESRGGALRAAINKNAEPLLDRWSSLQPDPQETLDIKLYPDGKKEIRLAAYDHFSPPRYDALPLGMIAESRELGIAGTRNPEIPGEATLSFECRPNECFAGTGERFFKMDLSGQTLFLKNQDGQGVNNRRTYKNIPFYLSSRMYGAFYHTTAWSKLSLAGHSTRSVQFLAKQPEIDCFLIGGDSPEEIIRGYRDLTGYPSMPPLWSFGVWMSRMTYFSADEVQGICDRLRNEHYPCDVIHLDTGWFETDWLCEWKFNKERFPDPEGFVRGLLKKGFHTSLWQLPYVAEDAEQITEARANKYIAEPENRQASEGSNFSSLDYAGTIDFTYDKATEWYKGLLRNLLNMGVQCIKTDFGENIHMDAKYHGMPAERLNNLYALLYQKAAYEVTKEIYPEEKDKDGVVRNNGIIWARSAWAGAQRYPLHWGGDSCSSWDGLAGSLKGGIHFGLSGFAFWSHDVPGFHTLPNFMNTRVDDKVYVRWTQFGVFTSHIRYHGTNKREPWHYPAIADTVKRWWNLRYMLIPYILKESEKACNSGSTLLQALIFHHPDDKLCWHIDDEYYFGDDILVAPVMNSDDCRDVYLPEGEWKEFFTGREFRGGTWLKNLQVPLDYMPVFIRKGAEIPIYPERVDCTDQMDLGKTQTVIIDDSFKGFQI